MVDTPTTNSAVVTAGENAYAGTYTDTADVRRKYRDQLQEIANLIAAKDIETATKKVMEIIALESAAIKENTSVKIGLENAQGSIGNMMKIFGTIIKALGGEEFGQGMIDLANKNEYLRFDQVRPDTSSLQALRTELPPQLQGLVTNVLENGFNGAYTQGQQTPGDVINQGDRASRTKPDRAPSAAAPNGGNPQPQPRAAPVPEMSRASFSSSLQGIQGLSAQDKVHALEIFDRVTKTTGDRDGKLDQAENPALRQALGAMLPKLEPII